MKASVAIPTCTEGLCYPVGASWGPKAIMDLSVLAEKLGFDSVWGNDHLATQAYVAKEYADPPNYYEPLISLAWVAGRTSTLRLGTGVLVLPMRDPVVLAKQVASLDQISGGRLTLGVGIGAYREEFEATMPERAKMQRGELLDEGVQALRILFTQRRASFEGKLIRFENVEMFPKPVQDPFPIYIGGNADSTLDRVGRWADGWFPAVQSADAIRAKVERIKTTARAAGRNPDAIDIAPQVACCVGKTKEEAEAFFKNSQLYRHLVSLKGSTLKGQDDVIARFAEYNLLGTADQIVERARNYAAAGVTHLCSLIFPGDTAEQMAEQMELFARDVLPHIAEF